MVAVHAYFPFPPGEEEEAEHVGDNEHVEDEAPMAAACEGSRQQWTNGCSNAEMVRLMTKVSHHQVRKIVQKTNNEN